MKFERRGGGKGANQAVAIARAGGAVSFVGAVGEDGAWVVRDLEGYGVSTADISVVQVCPQCLQDGDLTLALTGVQCRRRSPAALSFNSLRRVKIASVRLCPPVASLTFNICSTRIRTQSCTRGQTLPCLILRHRAMSNDTLQECRISFCKMKFRGPPHLHTSNMRTHGAL